MKKAAIITAAIWGLAVLCLLAYLALDRPTEPAPDLTSVDTHRAAAVAAPESADSTPAGNSKPLLPAAEIPAGSIYFDFRGNEAFSGRMLESALQVPSDVNPEETLTLVQEGVRRFYLAYGYINVQVSCQLASSDPPLFELEITEGTRFVWDDFQIESETLPGDSLHQFFAVEKGHPVNMLEHVKSLSDLADAFQEQGYLSFSYIPEVRADKNLGTFSTKINVKEGPRYILAAVSSDLPEARIAMSDLIGHPYSIFEVSRRLARLGLGNGNVRVDKNVQRGEVYLRKRSN